MGPGNIKLNRIILSLGSNIGDRLQNLKYAKAELNANGCNLLLESSVYETEAWGNTEQSAFYNIAVEAETNLSPQRLMQTIISIEEKMGRVRNKKWEPRIIDIDILFYNTEIIHEPHLTIPHPHLHKRKFVLEPLDEIIPFYLHPVFKQEIHSLYSQLNDSLKVSRLFASGQSMKSLNYNYIVVEGNIGTGKTSLANRLSNEFNTRLILERFADNPFLPKFYENRLRYAFPLELSFLADRYQQLKNELTNLELFQQNIVSDYLLNKSLIFAGITLKDDEFDLYQKLFHIINPHLPKPDLLIYLHKDVHRLKQNIRKRGRDYEQNIEDDYLQKLENGYWNFFRQLSNVRIVVIDTNEIDFIGNEEHYNKILEIINADYEFGLHRVIMK